MIELEMEITSRGEEQIDRSQIARGRGGAGTGAGRVGGNRAGVETVQGRINGRGGDNPGSETGQGRGRVGTGQGRLE